MEWEPRAEHDWVKDAERWIAQIRGVRQCKIDIDPEGEVTGVHVVSGTDRDPRHVVRDVEGLLKARLGLNVFYKKIGVVQVMDQADAEGVEDTEGAEEAWTPEPASDEPAEPAGAEEDMDEDGIPAVLLAEDIAPRVRCTGVAVLASDMIVRAEVELQAGSLEARGVEEGPNHAESDIALVARATVAAVRQLLDEPVLLTLAEARLALVGGSTVAVVALELVEGRRSERLFGTCPTNHNRQQAVVYAVLDALNRRLALMALKTGEIIA
ncbi:MAG: hypothetical protein R6X25_11100 [Candidatus Krumholzibacteriia bacterium]